MKKVLILYNEVKPGDREDELDVLKQVDLIEQTLIELNYSICKLGMNIDIRLTKNEIQSILPDIVFNLVEALDGKAELIHVAPSLLVSQNFPFTGAGPEAMMMTSHKVLAKEMMELKKISTASWHRLNDISNTVPEKKYLLKPVWEDGSVGIDDNLIYSGRSSEINIITKDLSPIKYFIEEYIHGREFNISILGGETGPVVLPPAEIKFQDYPDDKPFIVGFKAKWDESSFEYHHTIRSFDFQETDETLIEKLKKICIDCWYAFKLNGYARVDFRVDKEGNPFVLEVNANPCLSPDAGFYAASRQANLPFTKVVENIITDAMNRKY